METLSTGRSWCLRWRGERVELTGTTPPRPVCHSRVLLHRGRVRNWLRGGSGAPPIPPAGARGCPPPPPPDSLGVGVGVGVESPRRPPPPTVLTSDAATAIAPPATSTAPVAVVAPRGGGLPVAPAAASNVVTLAAVAATITRPFSPSRVTT